MKKKKTVNKNRKRRFTTTNLEIFKNIEINIPFAYAITQMPHYAKFLKDILTKKKKIVEEVVVSLTATCSAVIQKSLLAKMKDP